MARQRRRDLLTVVALVALVGLLVVPQIAVAHKQTAGHKGSAVEIHHGKGSRAANVSGGRLQTTVHGGFIDAQTSMNPPQVIDEGTGDGTGICGDTDLYGVVASGEGDILVEDTDGGTLWRAQVPAGSTVETWFGGRAFILEFLGVDVTADSTVNWILYGLCFGPGGLSTAESPERSARG